MVYFLSVSVYYLQCKLLLIKNIVFYEEEWLVEFIIFFKV